MSELKVIKIELNNHGKPIVSIQGTTSYYGISPNDTFYQKSEADKVIEELKDKLQAADNQIENLINNASSIMLLQDRANDNKCTELRHQKYKRCLANAEACMHKRWRPDERFDYARSTRHMKKWLEIAEKFKEG